MNSQPPSPPESLSHQTAIVLTAFVAALCKQPAIDGQRLKMDFLDVLEGIATSPQKVGSVGMNIAGLMESILQEAAADKPRPD